MTPVQPDFETDVLGECKIVSPFRGIFMDASKRVLFRISMLPAQLRAGVDPPAFELAGPRDRIYFNPATLRCGIVTCGGLCPGLTDVNRSIVFCLHEKYGVPGSLRLPFRLRGSSRGKRIDADRIDDPQSKSNP
jgi:6-phosphofructokinase 1